MKKSLFFALFACVALAFVSCEQNKNNPNALTGITVTPAEVALVPGDEVRLSVALVPATAVLGENEVITWASSDTSVVVVNNKGTITAVGYGKANVTVTCGEFTGVCTVWVKTYYENLAFTNAIVWDVDTTAFGGEVYEITTADSSETFNCYLAMAELWLCADGFYINESGMLEGGTYASHIIVNAPMYYGTPYLNPGKGGVQFVLGDWALANLPADSVVAHIGAPGTLNEEAYLSYMNAAVESYNAADYQMYSTYLALIGGYVTYPEGWPVAITGATMSTLEYSVDEETGEGGYSSNYIPDGIITEGQWGLNGDGVSVYMCGMDYNYLKFREFANTEDYIWGCYWLLNEDGTQITWGDQNMHWGEEVTYQFGELPAAEAQEMKPLHLPVLKIDYPEVAERIEKQIKANSELKMKK